MLEGVIDLVAISLAVVAAGINRAEISPLIA